MLELRAGIVTAAQLQQEVATNARQQVVVAKSGLVRERVDELEPRSGSEGHGDSDYAIQLDDRRARDLHECVIEGDDLLPVRCVPGAGPRVASGDGGLDCVRA